MKYILFTKNPKFLELESELELKHLSMHYRLIQPRQRFASRNAYKR